MPGRGGTRKHGRGGRKAAKSRWGSFAGIIGHSEMLKAARGERRRKRLKARRDERKCAKCGEFGFIDRRSLVRHVKRCGVVKGGAA
jgi:hypothetical protein